MPRNVDLQPSPELTLATIRPATEKLLRELNGKLTPQEKKELLACKDQLLLQWYQQSANGNLDAYRTALILQGTCNRSAEPSFSENR